ncbi:MAG: 23S rRNA (guanosine(2251)-2'-O)-methyltransferase RlmB [Oscillospiraceae bacterium]|nr:23S rRNA (guanosine(2251)-2'-O)-methyltransferase RlmB [Oscillospiraceae bacterium]
MGNNTIEGRRAVTEVLKSSGQPIDKLFVLESAKGLAGIINLAKANGAVIIQCNRARLDGMSMTGTHQGVIASVAACAYSDVEDIFLKAQELDEPPFIVVCDEIQDERNLGAIIRSCEVTGVHGVVVPKRRSAGITAHTMKSSTGAACNMPIARVPGIVPFLGDLRERGVWVYGAAGEGEHNAFETDFSGPAALVLGNEQEGLRRLVRENCDKLCRLPMHGKTGSLNVSCAAAVLMYQIALSRNKLLE